MSPSDIHGFHLWAYFLCLTNKQMKANFNFRWWKVERWIGVCLRLCRKDGRESSWDELSVSRHCWSAAGRKGHTHKPGRGSLKEAERWGKRVNHSLSISNLLGLFTLEGHLLDEINYLEAMSRSLGIREKWSSAVVYQSHDPEHMTFPSVPLFPGCQNKL